MLSNRHFYEEMVMTTWAAEGFAGAELGDGRLNRRLIKLAAKRASMRRSCGNQSMLAFGSY